MLIIYGLRNVLFEFLTIFGYELLNVIMRSFWAARKETIIGYSLIEYNR